MCDKSTLFTRYNHLRTLAYQHPELIDLTRLNKALGIAQSGDTCQHEVAEYHPTGYTCGCKDQQYSYARNRKTIDGQQYPGPCKHRMTVVLTSEQPLAKLVPTLIG